MRIEALSLIRELKRCTEVSANITCDVEEKRLRGKPLTWPNRGNEEEKRRRIKTRSKRVIKLGATI